MPSCVGTIPKRYGDARRAATREEIVAENSVSYTNYDGNAQIWQKSFSYKKATAKRLFCWKTH